MPDGLPDIRSALAGLPRDDLERFNTLLQEYERRRIRKECHQSFEAFVRHAWQHIEPDALIWEPHMTIVCKAMQAFGDGIIKRLLINIPPGTAKSLLVSVMFPAWMWTRKPQYRLLALSGGEDVAVRDSVRCRRLIQGDWYQRHFGDQFKFAGDQNAKTNWQNNKGGFRDSDSIGSTVTGRRGDAILIDDPHDAMRIRSDPDRQKVLDAFDEKLSTRLNSQDTGGTADAAACEREVTAGAEEAPRRLRHSRPAPAIPVAT